MLSRSVGLSPKRPTLSARQIRECRAIVRAVSAMTGVSVAEIRAPSRCRMQAAHARQLAMYLCHVVPGLTMTQVGSFFGRDRTTVAHACALIEDTRDDRAADQRIQALEDQIAIHRSALPVLGEVSHAPL